MGISSLATKASTTSRAAPATGTDTVIGGAGNDTINVQDGQLDSFSCGGGNDSVKADQIDTSLTPSQCEKVQRK